MDRKFTWQEQRMTTPDGVYRVLRTAILNGTVPPGNNFARRTSPQTSASVDPRSVRR